MQLAAVHRWVGLTLCASLLVMSVSGTLLRWKREYLLLTIPGAAQTIDRQPQSIAKAIERITASYPPGQAQFVQLYSEQLALHKVFLSDKRYAWHAQNGQQIQQWRGNQRWEDWLLDLHHRFLLGNTIGLNIAGFSGLLVIPLMLLGLLLWWPRRRSFRLGVTPKYPGRDAWRISHGNLGVLAALPILLLVVTGVILVYPQQAKFVLLDGFSASTPADQSALRDSQRLPKQPSMRAAIDHAGQVFPQSQLRWVSLPNAETRQFSLGVQRKGAWNATGQSSIEYHADGMISIKNAEQQGTAKRVFDFSYPLHAGKFSVPLRVMLSIIGLALSLLCLFGLRSYSLSRTKRD